MEIGSIGNGTPDEDKVDVVLLQEAFSKPMPVVCFDPVTASMEADDYYRTHNMAECRAEWHRRFTALRAAEELSIQPVMEQPKAA